VNINVLKEVSISKIEMIYDDDGGKKHREVSLGYYDEEICYFSLNTDLNFLLPKLKSEAEILVYSPDGIFKSVVKFLRINKSVGKVLFEVTAPAKWDFIQRRKNLRKQIPLPVSIKYEDGFEITTRVNDISAGGLTVYKTGAFSGIYQKLEADISIEFPEGVILHMNDNIVHTKARCVRVEENLPGHFGENLVAYEFIHLNSDIANSMRRYISMYN
jgi:hypothetical protein